MTDDFQAALQRHLSGDLHGAEQLYRQLLSARPNHADALHLLGLVAHQQGRPHQAVELIGRAIALAPGVATFYANLAEVHRAVGQLDRAAQYCRTALRLQPDFVPAVNNLGLVLLAQGDANGAAEQFRAALRLAPNDAMLHNNLGNALRLGGEPGKVAEALACFRQAVRLDPSLAEAHSNLGQLLLEGRQLPAALHHCQEAVRLRPDLAEAHNNLGNVLREMGALAEAKSSYAAALRLNPDHAVTYGNMAQALQQEGYLHQAVLWYHQGLQRDPDSARLHCHLASALSEREDAESALRHYNLALQRAPEYAEAHNGLGQVLHEQGDYPGALARFREVVRLKPDFVGGYCSLGNLLEELGSFDEAVASFREALKRDPNHADAHALLATLLRSKLPEEDLQASRALLARGHLPLGRALALHFGIAAVLDARGEYAEAAEHLQKGNALCLELWRKQGKAYDPQNHTRFIDALIHDFDASFFERVRGHGLDTEVPVFIVGLPRSGTTLTEQVLASHSQVFGAGERIFARDTFQALPARAGQLPAEVLRPLAQRHLERLRALDGSALRIVDKMPENYLYLGLLAALFPRAKFIHCRRDLRDIAVSCWMTNFRQIRWAADPEHIATRFQEYQRLMEHWKRVLPVEVLEVEYEETVSDLEGVARRLVRWCGLEWEPRCLEFHRTQRPIRTASVTQVRQPVYTRSVARWKHYEPALGALFARLGPAVTAPAPPG